MVPVLNAGDGLTVDCRSFEIARVAPESEGVDERSKVALSSSEVKSFK